MKLNVTALRADPEKLDGVIDVVANLEGDLRLEVDGEVYYEEVSFPVAELAAGLAQWSQAPPADRPDFEFDSMSAEEPGLLWIRCVDGGWRVGSIHQERPQPRVFTAMAIENLVREYITELARQVRATYGPTVAAHLMEAFRTAA